jgi:hypothetical protein
MRRIAIALLTAVIFSTPACGHQNAADVQASPSDNPMLIDDRGVVMPLDTAMTKISYRPWIPPRQVVKFAVIPPLGDLDTPDHRGIAMEYQAGKALMLLSEWPKQNFTLLFLHDQDISLTPCTIAHYKTDGVAWTTNGKLAMTLQPDGNVNPKDVDAEARRLIAAGGCR